MSQFTLLPSKPQHDQYEKVQKRFAGPASDVGLDPLKSSHGWWAVAVLHRPTGKRFVYLTVYEQHDSALESVLCYTKDLDPNPNNWAWSAQFYAFRDLIPA